MSESDLNRREVLTGMLAAGGAMLMPDPLLHALEAPQGPGAKSLDLPVQQADVRLKISEICSLLDVDGLAQDENPHPLQAAFVEHDAFQCGYCTSGQIMSGVACIQEGHTRSDDEIREWMSGNLCRCGAYPNIVSAVRQASRSRTV